MGSCRSVYTNNVDKIKNSKYMKEKVVNIFPDVVPEKDIRILHTQSSHDYKYMTVNEAFKYRICNDIYIIKIIFQKTCSYYIPLTIIHYRSACHICFLYTYM